MATFTNNTKNTASFTNVLKGGASFSQEFLDIGSGFNLLIDSTYKLEIQSEFLGSAFNNGVKN